MIVLVDLDDWIGLYIEGELKLQGHSLSVRDVIELITGSRPLTIEMDCDVIEKLHYELPATLEEVEKAIEAGK